jgi:hypothetical protein
MGNRANFVIVKDQDWQLYYSHWAGCRILDALIGGPELAMRCARSLRGCANYFDGMVRPRSWARLAGESPVPVGTGAPGSRPRFVIERWRAKRGVESLFGGSKCAGRSVTRRESCSLVTITTEEPSRSCHGEGLCLSSPGPGSARRVLPGYGGRHVHTVWFGRGEARLPRLRRAKTRGISRW